MQASVFSLEFSPFRDGPELPRQDEDRPAVAGRPLISTIQGKELERRCIRLPPPVRGKKPD
jgi:hypothetical protein